MPTRIRLKDINQDRALDDEAYSAQLKALQRQLQIVQTAYITQNRRAIILFEGWDAAGKGSVIRRMAGPLDPRFCRVWPIAAPDEHELKRHYLYRFWRRLPGRGELAVFDRSWYGRVLVERIEGYCTEDEWRRAYGEINEFERLLINDETKILKFFLHVSADVQDRRLQERLEVPYKRWKTGVDDYRNREKRHDYIVAIEEMLAQTSTKHAPWHVIAADHKHAAHIDVLECVVNRLSHGVNIEPPELDPNLKRIAERALGIHLA